MAHQVSPLAPAAFPHLPPIAGVRLAAAETGIRYKNRPDVLLAVMEPGTSVAGCFTKSKSRSAPVDWCAESLKGGTARAVVINAGNANAFTGKAGVATVTAVAKAAAKLLDCKPAEIFQASTGVIGEPLNPSFITNALPKLAEAAEPDAWSMAAKAIMTTDTFPKAATVKAKLGGKTVTINGIAKGSGMIAPDMATMLVFIFTDAALPPKLLQKLLTKSVDRSFNCITVDGDTSTSDTVLLFATGAAGNAEGVTKDARLKGFAKALDGALHGSRPPGRQGWRRCGEIHRDRDHGC
jgi:glutamate N-acetyltransferase / amino-acid N-acetyltransferase